MNDFEKACSEIDNNDSDWFNTHENVIEFVKNADTATVTLCQGRYVSKLKRLAKEHPDDVHICKENLDGSIVAHVPVSYIKLSAPPKRELTEEQRAELAERMRNARKNTNAT